MATEVFPVAALGNLAINFDGRRMPVKESDRKPGPHPYYGASGIVDFIDDYIFDGEYLLISEDGENLRTRKTPIAFMARGKFWPNNHVHVIRGNEHADTRYLCYALSATDIGGYLTGSTMPKLTQGNLNRLPVISPPLSEQKRIAGILGALDDKIELNRKMNETLEQMAKTLFKSWFVDFDPVHAKAAGSQPAGMDKATADLFPDSLVESETGKIPSGWKPGSLSDLSEFSRESINPGESPSEIFDHYSLPSFDEGKAPKAEEGSDIKSNKLIVTKTCVLLSKLNPHIPRIWLPNLNASRRSICSTEFIVASAIAGCTREYLYALFISEDFSRTYGTLVTGTTGSHQRIRAEGVLQMRLPVPPSELISSFTDTIAPMLNQVARNTKESQALAELRDTLLPQLLSGDLKAA